jgi:hypothetical protein
MEVTNSDLGDTEVVELSSELFQSLVIGLSCVEVDPSKGVHAISKVEYLDEH